MTRNHAARWMTAVVALLLAAGRADAQTAGPSEGTVLVLGPRMAAADDVVSGLVDELADRFAFVRRDVSDETSLTDLSRVFAETKPRVIVLLNNPTVRLYRTYQAAQPPGTAFVPAVILMTAFLEQACAGLHNVTGIAYEVPAVTALVNMRSVFGRPLARVGVLHRRAFAPFVARQAQLAAAEGFTIVQRVLAEGDQRDAVKRGLRQLLDYDHVDALWVLNDSDLVNPSLVARSWLPVLRHAHVPVLVGVPSLVSAKLPFGTFAVVPEHRSLGQQAATLIEKLAENDWRLSARHALSPISVEKILNLGLAHAIAPIKDEKLHEVDRIVDTPDGNAP